MRAHLRQFVGRFATYAGASPHEASAAFAMLSGHFAAQMASRHLGAAA